VLRNFLIDLALDAAEFFVTVLILTNVFVWGGHLSGAF
jgi:hypothetical protein